MVIGTRGFRALFLAGLVSLSCCAALVGIDKDYEVGSTLVDPDGGDGSTDANTGQDQTSGDEGIVIADGGPDGAAPVSLLFNGSFEEPGSQPCGSWLHYQNGESQRSDAAAYDGGMSCRVCASIATPATTTVYHKVIPLPATSARFRFVSHIISKDDAGAPPVCWNAIGYSGVIGGPPAGGREGPAKYVGPDEWLTLEIEFDRPAPGSASLSVHCEYAGVGGRCTYVDDVSLTAVP